MSAWSEVSRFVADIDFGQCPVDHPMEDSGLWITGITRQANDPPVLGRRGRPPWLDRDGVEVKNGCGRGFTPLGSPIAVGQAAVG